MEGKVTDSNEGALRSGLESLREMIEHGLEAPMGRTLSCMLVGIEPGRALVDGEPKPEFYNPGNTIHGGWSATLLDTACACAAHSRLPPGHIASTLELKVAFHRALTARSGTVRAEGRLTSMGRQVAFCEATLMDKAGRLVASASSTLLIMKA
jgi:uncharacterized protein (TIGR00369 family)